MNAPGPTDLPPSPTPSTPPRTPRPIRSADDSSWKRRQAQRSAKSEPFNPVLPTLVPSGSQLAYRADFSEIRYGQCWEDADALLAALAIKPGDVCLSVCSAGDNTLALLAANPAKVVAVDLNPAQLACLELRVAAYRLLDYEDLLVLMGSRRGIRRQWLYAACREKLSRPARAFWDARPEALRQGLGAAGKFERAVSALRRHVLPMVHPQSRLDRLLVPRSREERALFYANEWDNWRWRLMFRLMFSRTALAWSGQALAAFAPSDEPVAERVLARARLHLTEHDPLDNPYAHWLLTGTHGAVLPYALRAEVVPRIRANLDRLEWRLCALEDLLEELGNRAIDRFHLGDHCEYLAEPAYHTLLYRLCRAGRRGGRLVYWNRFIDRRRPAEMIDLLVPQDRLAETLFADDRTLFASRLVIEELA
jgi:S-adenosylmethionine-diacylglycerol 3-amino-3-carboxypropyl transferase